MPEFYDACHSCKKVLPSSELFMVKGYGFCSNCIESKEENQSSVLKKEGEEEK